MQRRLWLRALLALWGLWFTAAISEPAGLFVCAMHSGTAGMQMGGHAHGGMRAAKTSSHGMQHAASGSHAAHRSPSVAAGGEPDASVSEPTPPQTHNCTCLGECCAVVPATIPTPQLQVALGIAISRAAEPPAHAREITPPAQLLHVLPFANGPPRAA